LWCAACVAFAQNHKWMIEMRFDLNENTWQTNTIRHYQQSLSRYQFNYYCLDWFFNKVAILRIEQIDRIECFKTKLLCIVILFFVNNFFLEKLENSTSPLNHLVSNIWKILPNTKLNPNNLSKKKMLREDLLLYSYNRTK